ncbi:MAG: GDP-mannose 4,6-dehydratase [Candidatus Sabulitectum sp.]|nr:GDP-mannose 4,6-dehydratase [Candidatus Sabulitectum sp.]
MMKVSEASVEIEYEPERPGDVRDSLADVSKAREAFGFDPSSDIEEGLREYMSWIQTDPITKKRLKL